MRIQPIRYIKATIRKVRMLHKIQALATIAAYKGEWDKAKNLLIRYERVSKTI